MIRYIHLKNYKSFTDLSFDMTGKNGLTKKILILYGENGVGKTNLVNVLDTLYDSFQTLNFRSLLLQFLGNEGKNIDSSMLSFSESKMEIASIIRDNKTVDSNEDMTIEIGFSIGERLGVYKIEFDDERIIRERLEYVFNKNKIVFFDISIDNRKINPQIVSSSFLSELDGMLYKYWGKHSVIAIFFNAFNEYTVDFVQEAFSDALFDVLDYFSKFTVFLVKNKIRKGNVENNTSILRELDEGVVEENRIAAINHTESLLDAYFRDIYADVKKVYYKKEKMDYKISYRLYFRRMVSGKERDIRYDEESCGTRNLLALLPYFLASMEGHVVAIDEIDNGIHDILLKSLINNLSQNIDGQLIMTTHNTMFLEEYDLKDYVYFIEMDDDGNKEIKSINDFGFRIQQNSNVIANYLKGRFSRSPWNGTNIDFNRLMEMDKGE